MEGVDYIEIGIREAMKAVSVGLGQGFVRCNCNGMCATYFFQNSKNYLLLKAFFLNNIFMLKLQAESKNSL